MNSEVDDYPLHGRIAGGVIGVNLNKDAHVVFAGQVEVEMGYDADGNEYALAITYPVGYGEVGSHVICATSSDPNTAFATDPSKTVVITKKVIKVTFEGATYVASAPGTQNPRQNICRGFFCMGCGSGRFVNRPYGAGCGDGRFVNRPYGSDYSSEIFSVGGSSSSATTGTTTSSITSSVTASSGVISASAAAAAAASSRAFLAATRFT